MGPHAKGLVYRGAQDFYALRVPGGVEAVAVRLDPLERAFFEQRFLPGGWYDATQIFAISRSAAEASAITHAQLVRENAAWVARRDIHGVYKFLLRLASPGAVAVRLARASMQYFDFGTAESKLQGIGTCEAIQAGIPEVLGSWFAWAAEGFVPVALAASGATDIGVEARLEPEVGRDANMKTVRLSLTMRWAQK